MTKPCLRLALFVQEGLCAGLFQFSVLLFEVSFAIIDKLPYPGSTSNSKTQIPEPVGHPKP